MPGLIFELKAATKNAENLERLSAVALRQIDEKCYETEMRTVGIQEILKIGIAFRGKEIVVRTK